MFLTTASDPGQDPVFASALRCVRCGACANVCPIYRLVGGYNYGYVYIGAIGLILTYLLSRPQKCPRHRAQLPQLSGQ